MKHKYLVFVLLCFLGGCKKDLTVWLDDQVIESVATGKTSTQSLTAQLKINVNNSNCEEVKQLVIGTVIDYFGVLDKAYCNPDGLFIDTRVMLMRIGKDQSYKESIEGLHDGKQQGFIYFLTTENEHGFVAISPVILLSKSSALNRSLIHDFPKEKETNTVVLNSENFDMFIKLRNTLPKELPVRTTSVYVNGEPFPTSDITILKPGETSTLQVSKIQKDHLLTKEITSAPIVEIALKKTN